MTGHARAAERPAMRPQPPSWTRIRAKIRSWCSRSGPGRDLLSALQRAGGSAYLVNAAYGRYALLIDNGSHLQQLRSFNWPTIRRLQADRLIQLSHADEPIDYSGRRHRDGRSAQLISLTDAGKKRLTPTASEQLPTVAPIKWRDLDGGDPHAPIIAPGISRNDQFRMLGNGVVPQQTEVASRWLPTADAQAVGLMQPWRLSYRAYPRALPLADRHYNRLVLAILTHATTEHLGIPDPVIPATVAAQIARNTP